MSYEAVRDGSFRLAHAWLCLVSHDTVRIQLNTIRRWVPSRRLAHPKPATEVEAQDVKPHVSQLCHVHTLTAVSVPACVAAATAASAAGLAVLQTLVYGGALLYVFSKSAKFSLFKPAEEMVYISLDEEGRTKGKAAIDVVGSQAGKSGGSILQQVGAGQGGREEKTGR